MNALVSANAWFEKPFVFYGFIGFGSALNLFLLSGFVQEKTWKQQIQSVRLTGETRVSDLSHPLQFLHSLCIHHLIVGYLGRRYAVTLKKSLMIGTMIIILDICFLMKRIKNKPKKTFYEKEARLDFYEDLSLMQDIVRGVSQGKDIKPQLTQLSKMDTHYNPAQTLIAVECGKLTTLVCQHIDNVPVFATIRQNLQQIPIALQQLINEYLHVRYECCYKNVQETVTYFEQKVKAQQTKLFLESKLKKS